MCIPRIHAHLTPAFPLLLKRLNERRVLPFRLLDVRIEPRGKPNLDHPHPEQLLHPRPLKPPPPFPCRDASGEKR